MVRRVVSMAVFLAALAASASSAVAIDSRLEARKVVRRPDGREIFVPATEARPRDVIEYRLTCLNDGDEPVRHVAIVDPMPAGARYVPQSANRPRGGDVTFSIDGGRTYHAWPVRYAVTLDDGRVQWREATPEMVTHIRWTMAGDFEPDSAITLTYRAVVK